MFYFNNSHFFYLSNYPTKKINQKIKIKHGTALWNISYAAIKNYLFNELA